MANLNNTYFGTLFFAAMALTVALIWAACICIERTQTRKPDLLPDFQQVKLFIGLCISITLVLLAMGV